MENKKLRLVVVSEGGEIVAFGALFSPDEAMRMTGRCRELKLAFLPQCEAVRQSMSRMALQDNPQFPRKSPFPGLVSDRKQHEIAHSRTVPQSKPR